MCVQNADHNRQHMIFRKFDIMPSGQYIVKANFPIIET